MTHPFPLVLAVFAALVALASSGLAADPAASAPAPARPALAIKFSLEGDNAKLIVALNYLEKTSDVPKFVGVRFYTYTVPLSASPTRIGFDKKNTVFGEPLSALINGQKFPYMATATDRQENGAVILTKPAKPDGPHHLRGVYFYMNQLFFIDADLKPDEPLYLAESPPAGNE